MQRGRERRHDRVGGGCLCGAATTPMSFGTVTSVCTICQKSTGQPAEITVLIKRIAGIGETRQSTSSPRAESAVFAPTADHASSGTSRRRLDDEPLRWQLDNPQPGDLPHTPTPSLVQSLEGLPKFTAADEDVMMAFDPGIRRQAGNRQRKSDREVASIYPAPEMVLLTCLMMEETMQ